MSEWNLYHDMQNRSYNDIAEIKRLRKILEEIAQSCPILYPAPNVKTHLYEQSSKRRQELASNGLKRSESRNDAAIGTRKNRLV